MNYNDSQEDFPTIIRDLKLEVDQLKQETSQFKESYQQILNQVRQKVEQTKLRQSEQLQEINTNFVRKQQFNEYKTLISQELDGKIKKMQEENRFEQIQLEQNIKNCNIVITKNQQNAEQQINKQNVKNQELTLKIDKKADLSYLQQIKLELTKIPNIEDTKQQVISKHRELINLNNTMQQSQTKLEIISKNILKRIQEIEEEILQKNNKLDFQQMQQKINDDQDQIQKKFQNYEVFKQNILEKMESYSKWSSDEIIKIGQDISKNAEQNLWISLQDKFTTHKQIQDLLRLKADNSEILYLNKSKSDKNLTLSLYQQFKETLEVNQVLSKGTLEFMKGFSKTHYGGYIEENTKQRIVEEQIKNSELSTQKLNQIIIQTQQITSMFKQQQHQIDIQDQINPQQTSQNINQKFLQSSSFQQKESAWLQEETSINLQSKQKLNNFLKHVKPRSVSVMQTRNKKQNQINTSINFNQSFHNNNINNNTQQLEKTQDFTMSDQKPIQRTIFDFNNSISKTSVKSTKNNQNQNRQAVFQSQQLVKGKNQLKPLVINSQKTSKLMSNINEQLNDKYMEFMEKSQHIEVSTPIKKNINDIQILNNDINSNDQINTNSQNLSQFTNEYMKQIPIQQQKIKN